MKVIKKRVSHNIILNNNKYKKILYLLLYCIINICLFIILLNLEKNVWVEKITLISSIQLALNIILIINYGYKIFSLPILFIIFTYIFHLGQLILIVLDTNVERSVDIVNLVSNDLFIKACCFVIYSQMFVVLGIITINYKKKKITKDVVEKNRTEDQIKIIYIIGIVLFVIGLFPNVYLNFIKIDSFLKGDYLTGLTAYSETSGIIKILSQFFTVGILLIIIGQKSKKKSAKLFFAIVIVYQICTMISGSRGEQVISIITFVFLYINIHEVKINKKKLFLLILISYIGLILLNTLSDIRSMNNFNMELFFKIFCNNSIQESPILSAMGEFGGTMISLCYSMKFFPYTVKYVYGRSYLLSFLTVLPNFHGFLEYINNTSIFTYNFPEIYRMYLGGSYLGELYYNFGFIGVFCSYCIGILVGSISRIVTNALKKKKYLALAIFINLYPSILWWVRDYFINIVRNFAWMTIIILFLYYFIYSIRKEKK